MRILCPYIYVFVSAYLCMSIGRWVSQLAPFQLIYRSSHRVPQFPLSQRQGALEMRHRGPQPARFFVAHGDGVLGLPKVHAEAVYQVGRISPSGL